MSEQGTPDDVEYRWAASQCTYAEKEQVKVHLEPQFVRRLLAEHNTLVRLALPPDKLEEYVRALVAWAGLVVQYMEKGEPYWYGDSLKEQGRAALAPFAHLGGEP